MCGGDDRTVSAAVGFKVTVTESTENKNGPPTGQRSSRSPFLPAATDDGDRPNPIALSAPETAGTVVLNRYDLLFRRGVEILTVSVERMTRRKRSRLVFIIIFFYFLIIISTTRRHHHRRRFYFTRKHPKEPAKADHGVFDYSFVLFNITYSTQKYFGGYTTRCTKCNFFFLLNYL